MKYLNLTQCRDSNPCSSDHKDYALANYATDLTQDNNNSNMSNIINLKVNKHQNVKYDIFEHILNKFFLKCFVFVLKVFYSYNKGLECVPYEMFKARRNETYN